MSETTAKVLALLTHHLIANPSKLKRLRTELQSLARDPDEGVTLPYLPCLAELETFRHLQAVIREGLRLHNGIVARSQRIAPEETLRYRE